MKKFIIVFLFILILTLCQNFNNSYHIDSPLIMENEIIKSIEAYEKPTYIFQEQSIQNTIEKYFDKDIEKLTEEHLKELSQFDYLVVDDVVSSVEDIENFFPNIKYLYITVNELSTELYNSIKKLSSIKALTLYCSNITITDFDNNFEYFEIAYSADSVNLLSDNKLSKFSFSDEKDLNEHLKGNIKKMIRLNENATTYELFSTDNYTDGELFNIQERLVLVYENNSDIPKFFLDASYEIGAAVENRLQLAEVNFDGISDILIDNGHFGAQGAVEYTCFLNIQGNYVRSDSFSDIANPAIDIKNKKILSTWRNSAESHSFAMFAFQNNEFIMTDCLTESSIINDSWEYTIETLVGTSLQETESFTTKDYSDEEIHNKIYDENSYWGLLSDKWNTLYNQGKMVGFSIYGDSKINATIQHIISD